MRPDALLDDEREVSLAEGRMLAAQQFTRPDGHTLVWLDNARVAVDPPVEFGEGLGVGPGRAAQEQPIAQLARNSIGNGWFVFI